MQGYTHTRHSVRISVNPVFLENQSIPEDNQFLWAYHVRIENLSKEDLRLRKRHWTITDALGRIQEVCGDGVVGEQPNLQPGESFEYTSGTPLPTSSGIMAGFYVMEKQNGEKVEIEIPVFSLDSPHDVTSVH